MNDKDDSFSKFLLASLVFGIVLIGIALIIAALKMGSQVAASWVVFIFQLLFTFIGIIFSTVLAFWLIGKVANALVKRLDDLRRSHSEMLKKLQRRTSSFLATSILIANAVLLLADKSFKGEPLPTVTVSLLLLLFFWIANELLISTSRTKKALGFVLCFHYLLFTHFGDASSEMGCNTIAH